jgi:adenylate cyclase
MILTDEATYRSAKDAIEFRELDQVIVVGKIEPVRIYEVLGVSDSLSQEMVNIRETYAQGLDDYYHGQWDLAERAFFACLQIYPEDGPSKAMLGRISFLKASSSINTWDGVWKMENK